MARTANGKKRRRCLAKETFVCPLGCSEPFLTAKDVLSHVEAINIQRGGLTKDEGWLASLGRRLCEGCRRLMARSAPLCRDVSKQPQPVTATPPSQG